ARRGRAPIERRLDLHGLRQSAARRALGAFLVKASQEGCRRVLVITGKGAPSECNAQPTDGEPRGVIRRRFSEWIDEEPLRGLIARAAPAKPADGGAGAFYVFLKSRRAAQA
ncbi:MAG TPA: Smr/MutS family protein, partial [Parvularculaceae bacterium]|nr:Smr/MutS family protein [Parvularculaceae bacterium]